MAECSSAESILEAASLIKVNARKIDKFTNGTATETVQLGSGSPTPTLRKLVQDVFDDSSFVHKTGAETISGQKAFTETINGTADKAVKDGSGNTITATYATKTELNAKADDSSVVHTSGAETINDKKTFTNDTTIYSNTPRLYLKEKDMDMSSVSSNTYSAVVVMDKNDVMAGSWACQQTSSTGAVYETAVNGTGDGRKAIAVQLLVSSSISKFAPRGDNGTTDLGSSGNKWGTVYASTGSINTSDERLKESIASIDENLLDAWKDVVWSQFKFKDAIAKKGPDNARIHGGLIAQRVKAALEAHNVEAERYGFFCWDEWAAEDSVLDEHGDVLVPGQAAGEGYSLRYEEVFAVEAAFLRRENAALKERLSSLETLCMDLKERLDG